MERVIFIHALLPSVFSFLVVLGVLFLIFSWLSTGKWKKTVEQTSYKLRSLREYNALWTFAEIKEQYTYRKELDSIDQYEHFNPDILLSTILSDNLEKFVNQLSQIQSNQYLYHAYQKGLQDQILETPEKVVKQCRVPLKYYYRIEQQLYKDGL